MNRNVRELKPLVSFNTYAMVVHQRFIRKPGEFAREVNEQKILEFWDASDIIVLLSTCTGVCVDAEVFQNSFLISWKPCALG